MIDGTKERSRIGLLFIDDTPLAYAATPIDIIYLEPRDRSWMQSMAWNGTKYEKARQWHTWMKQAQESSHGELTDDDNDHNQSQHETTWSAHNVSTTLKVTPKWVLVNQTMQIHL